MKIQECNTVDFFKVYTDLLNTYCGFLDIICGSKTEIETYSFAAEDICANLKEYRGQSLAFTKMKANKIYFRPELFITWLSYKPLKIAYKNERNVEMYENDILLYVACHEYVHCKFNLSNHTKNFSKLAMYLFNEVKKEMK